MINARNNYEKSRYAKSQIIAVLREVDAGRKVEKVCLQYGIKSATYNNWKSKYGGMEATDVNRLKELEEENAKLKKMLSDVSLENNAIKKIVAKKGGTEVVRDGIDMMAAHSLEDGY